MTINQFGGIFGRNPTFNDVTIEDDLTAKTLTVTGAAAVDSLDLPNAADWSYITNNTPIGGLRFGTQDAAGVFSNQVEISAWGGYVKLNADVPITGNLVISTSGNGIDFSATSGTGTSELLDDYEEGTWTPTVSSAAGTVTVTSTSGSTYTKIGRTVQVNASITMTTDASVGTSDLTIGGLPFAVVGGGTGNLSYSNWSSGDYGAGGAHGLVRLLGSNMFHVNRSIDISGRSSFGFIYYAVYTAS